METTHKYFISEYIVTVNIDMRHLNKWIFECFPIEIAYHFFFWGGGGCPSWDEILKKKTRTFYTNTCILRYTTIHYKCFF